MKTHGLTHHRLLIRSVQMTLLLHLKTTILNNPGKLNNLEVVSKCLC